MQYFSLPAWLKRYRLLWTPPVLLLLAALFYPQLLALEHVAADYLFFCQFYNLTGLYCPGCGGTRSLTALLHGHFLLALHENPLVPALLVIILLFYIERIGILFGKKFRLLPRNLYFWFTLAGLHLVWALLRNFIPALMPIS